jgi:hypothetical protein
LEGTPRQVLHLRANDLGELWRQRMYSIQVPAVCANPYDLS